MSPSLEGLMEDRATLRISSQHIANWLRHGLVADAQVRSTFAEMAVKVDAQNAGDATYTPLTPGLDKGVAYRSALALVFGGESEPNGYTERVLHAGRRERKAELAAAKSK